MVTCSISVTKVFKQFDLNFIMNETCPVPLVETRKALRKEQKGDIVEVVGTHPSSKKEIPIAVKALGLELILL